MIVLIADGDIRPYVPRIGIPKSFGGLDYGGNHYQVAPVFFGVSSAPKAFTAIHDERLVVPVFSFKVEATAELKQSRRAVPKFNGTSIWNYSPFAKCQMILPL